MTSETIISDESSSESSSEILNSATEISTDSEFAQDDPTPTREIPAIVFNDFNVTKTRGTGSAPKKLQVTTGYLQKPLNGKALKKDIELKLKPLVPSAPVVKKPAPLLPRTENYALSRTQSTGGIAAKMSLELKKKYLLGEANHPGNIQKSGSASTLDTKFKSFVTNISDFQQKLFKPAQNIPLFKLSDPLISPQSPKNLIDTATAKDLPPPDVTNVSTTKQIIDSEPYEFENETEGRPRSPLHETSIIVPNINWDKKDDTQSDDSLSSGSFQALPNFSFNNIPRVEVHEAKDDENQDDIPPDSLCLEVVDKKLELETGIHSISSEPPKSISSERKMLNQPKSLPSLESVLPEIHKSLHIKYLKEKANNDSPENEVKENASERSSPDSCMEQATAALTETELSDWARDGAVSDDLEDFEFTREIESLRSHKRRKEVIPRENIDSSAADFDDMIHICGKEKYFIDEHNKAVLPVTATNILNANLDIDFMDTGTETSSDDGLVDSRNGYVLFKDEDELAEDSLNPTIDDIFEAKNLHVGEKPDTYKNTGYCVLATEDNFGSQVVDLKSSDLEKLKQKQNLTDHEEDSLVIIETGTTTEENTCSDSTVKNLTELIAEKTQNNKYAMDNSNFQKQRLEEKLAKLKAEKALNKQNNSEKKGEHSHDKINVEFDEHCQRLQSKVEFSNVKDSIDIRKSRRKSRSETSQKPDLIQEEKERSSPLIIKKDITLNLAPSVRTPDILYKKEIIEKERDVNQKLIQEMVMNKMKAENKSLERKKRSRTTSAVLSSKQPYELSKSATTEINFSNLDKYNCKKDTSVSTTPDVLLTTNQIRLQKSQTLSMVPDINSSTEKSHTPKSPNKEKYYSRPLSIHSIFNDNNTAVNNSLQDKSPSTQTVKKTLFSEDFKTPVAPPRQKHEEAKKTAEKLKQDARARARLLSNEDLGLSPEEKLNRIREKISRVRGNENVDPHVQESIESLVKNTERRNSWLYSNDNQNKYRNNSFKRSNSTECGSGTSKAKLSPFQYSNDNLVTPSRTKSISEFPKSFAIVKPQERESDARKMCKSDPNLLETDYKKSKKKNKDRESRKSITKLFSSLLSNGSKGIFSRISPKSKDISKEILVEEPVRRKSLSEVSLNNKIEDILPPPIPPLPLNYTGTSIKGTDESSDGENDHKNQDRSSCDTLDRSVNLEASMSSGRRASKSARRAARQAQVKRHRMAQEIQRKLEETEVKTRELESRGVLIEKALRGEDTEGANKDESELLQEWFDLMRDRTELQRYEKELVVRAQELELEDRHARLQHELRERLENDDKKTPDDVETEGSIIKEMMEIVAKRDSLIGLLEEARIRYSNEDRDFEEQMLAKGLRLTPIRKTTEK